MDKLVRYFTDFSPKQLEQFQALDGLYRSWNEQINVISRKDVDHFYDHHVLHSLAIAAVFEFQAGDTVLDLGTGGGFPGVPLAILFPDTRFVLVDSINKKLNVIRAVSESIGLSNIQTRHVRVEEIKDLKVDAVVSRAVAPLGKLWGWSKPLFRKSDRYQGLICLKGGDLTQELHESGCRPKVWEVESLFPDPYFHEKYLLQVR